MNEHKMSGGMRKGARKRPLSLVYVELASANGGMLRDISETGFAMRAMMPVRVGESSPFTFSLDGTTRLEGQCKVLWVEEDGRAAGLQFTEVSSSVREHLHAWLNEKHVNAAPVSASAVSRGESQASTLEELREEIRTVAARPEINQDDEEEEDDVASVEPEYEKLQVREEKQTDEIAAEESAFVRLRGKKREEPQPDSRNLTPKVTEEVSGPASGPVASLTPSPDPPAVPVLAPIQQSLPSLEPLPGLYEMENAANVRNRKPWLARTLLWLAVRMMVVLALAAAVVVYHRPVGNAIIWLGQRIVGEDKPEIVPTPKSEITLPPQEITPRSVVVNPDSGSTGTPDKATKDSAANNDKKPVDEVAITETPSANSSKGSLPPAPVPLPATNKVTTFTSPTTTADGGQQEYLAAEDILKGKNLETGLPEAVRLLWAAVEKGNSSAEIALAELYRKGLGVAKNCDQTKILLSAAAKKGNAVAQKHLEQFLAEGCE